MGDTCDTTAMVLNYILVHCTYNHMPTIPLAPNTLAQVVNIKVSPYHSSRLVQCNPFVAKVIWVKDDAARQ